MGGRRCISIGEAAEHCGVSVSAFRNWVSRGLVPGPIDGTRRYDKKAIDIALKQQACPKKWKLAQLRDQEQSERSYVYFIRAGKAVKIGFSGWPHSRMTDIQHTNPEKLELLGFIPGGLETERALHEEFAKHRLRGEWFRFTEEIQKFIREQTE